MTGIAIVDDAFPFKWLEINDVSNVAIAPQKDYILDTFKASKTCGISNQVFNYH